MSEYKKIAATDLDGTIVDRNNKISKTNLELIQNFMDKTNNAFTVVTGRNYFLAEEHVNNLKVTLPVITTNGISVIDPKTKKYIAKNHFSKDEIFKIIEILREGGIGYDLLGDFDAYLTKDSVNCRLFENTKFNLLDSKDVIFNVYENQEELYKNIKEKVNEMPSIYVECSDEQYKQFVLNLLKDLDIEVLEFMYANRIVLEFYKKGSGKDWGLDQLRKFLEIEDKNNVYIFGDEFNDYPMFKEYKNSYAVGNAIEGIKKLAKEVILDFDKDGVGIKLNELIQEFN
ncbi:HAD family hydrolase [Spiroplasma chinense]|uniref:HAD family hydrolase n=1 Tax=Spiroplasma chinense TaxID=216932 RepID=A0A5B9Y547_9MOLU|nr:HAD-IIB family hydrolase [Spiroplasma chinense]QEH61913.1 HAD family hydrolase [Spiroplasma chinense]